MSNFETIQCLPGLGQDGKTAESTETQNAELDAIVKSVREKIHKIFAEPLPKVKTENRQNVN